MEATFTSTDTWGTKIKKKIQNPNLKVKMLPYRQALEDRNG